MKADEFAKRVRDVVPDLERGPSDSIARCPACGRHTLSFGNGKAGLRLMCYFGCEASAIVASVDLVLDDLAEAPAPAPATTGIHMIGMGDLFSYLNDVLVAARAFLQQTRAPIIERWRAAAEDLRRVAPFNVPPVLQPYAERIQVALFILPPEMLTSRDLIEVVRLIDEMIAAIGDERRRLPHSEGGSGRGPAGQEASP